MGSEMCIRDRYNIGIVSKGVHYDMGNRTKDLRLLGRCHVDGYDYHVDGILTLYAGHYP